MGSGFSIGRFFGVKVNVDWSWLFIFLLVAWNLASAVFPELHPDWSVTLNWALAIAAALLFFASVLAHELAHSLVAKAGGLPVRNITLFMFGGVSNIEREPPSPRSEFLMAIVGPLTSLVLGVLFSAAGVAAAGSIAALGLNGAGRPLAGLSPLATLLLWLGPINILLGVFNMVPGFPLDGGRVLRSILWAITGNLRRATRWASSVGQLVAWLFIVAGIAMAFGVEIPFFGTGLVSGLWLAFIGWFLQNAAVQSYRQVVVHDLLEGVPVGRLMRANPPTVTPDAQLSQLVDDVLMGSDERAIPVVENERLAGLVCIEDLRKVPRREWESVPVRQVMTPADKLTTVSPADEVTSALDQIMRRDVRQLPVVQDGRLVGLLRRQDIMRWLQLHSEAAAA